MADHEKNKERLKEITDSIEHGIQDLFQSDRYAQYLSTMSRFHRYSVNNTMLIYLQKPDATLVAGFNKWRDQFSRNVMRGQKGIKIIAPTPFKKKIEEEKLDPDTKVPMRNADGNIIMEEREIKIPMYKVVSVFDVSQTEGKPLPTLASNLTGNVQQYEVFMEVLRRSSPVPMGYEAMEPNMDGYFSENDQRIAIRTGMSEVQAVSAAVHEITHATLHNYEQARLAAAQGDETAEPPKPKDRNTEEVEAESVSFVVCQYYGIQTGENSFGYIATWSKGKEMPELRASLETINKTASGLISEIDQNFREVLKEYDSVLEQFASDVYQYTAAAMEPPLPLHTAEEEIPNITEELKSGYGKDIRKDIQSAEKAEGAASPDTLLRRLDEIEKIYPPKELESMYLLDDSTYLHLKESAEGYDYTLYDKESLRETGSGFADEGVSTISTAYEQAIALENLFPATSEKMPLDILRDIAAVRERDIEQYKRENHIDRKDADGRMEDALSSHGANDLIASYEELFVTDAKDHIMTWYGDLAMHVPKDGVSREAQYQVYQTALKALGETHETFQSNERYFYRGNIMVDMCLRNSLPISDYILNQLPQEERSTITAAQMSETEAALGQLPDALEQALDEYPMPTSELAVADLEACGYLDGDMLPVSKDRALELFEQDLTVYMIEDGDAGMAFDTDEIQTHSGLFAVSREEWEESRDFTVALEGRMKHQEQREKNFLNASQDAFAIYQIKGGDELRDIRFEPLSWLESKGVAVDHGNYDLAYTAPLAVKGNTEDRLAALWQRFNNDHPADYHRPSLSVSDIVALKQNGVVSCHYVDSFGFQELPAFLKPENYLKNAEMAMEDDYGMLDGIINNGPKATVAELEQQAKTGQPISLMELAQAQRRERDEKKKSVVQQLRNQPVSREHKKTRMYDNEREV